MRVLVVDDDPDVIATIEALLDNGGFDVTGSSTADRARVRLSAKHYDILLIDAPMNRLSGVSLAEEARSTGAAVLMIPASEDTIPRIEAAGLAYLSKPFRAVDLVAAIGCALK